MTIERENLIKTAVVLGFVFLLGCVVGFFIGKGMYQTHEGIKIIRDTVTMHDTVTHYLPPPKDTMRVRYVTRLLPMARRDTVSQVVMMHDTVAVEVPITSKHYGSKDYDAWVSGYEPSLDSIKVYKETQYITETIEKVKVTRRKPWGIGFHVGYGYDFKSKTAAPFIGVGLSYDIISF